jgi:hypothetical protein
MNKMRRLKILLIAILTIFGGILQAQISVNLHIGTPPPWAPSGHTDIRFYYLPDVEAYYDVQSSLFIYQSGKKWVHRSHLPARYRNYNLYNGRKVMMSDYRGNSPYTHFREHKMKYGKGNRSHSQNDMKMPYRKGHTEAPHHTMNNRENSGKGHDNRKQGGDNHNNKKDDNGKGDGNDRRK